MVTLGWVAICLNSFCLYFAMRLVSGNVSELVSNFIIRAIFLFNIILGIVLVRGL